MSKKSFATLPAIFERENRSKNRFDCTRRGGVPLLLSPVALLHHVPHHFSTDGSSLRHLRRGARPNARKKRRYSRYVERKSRNGKDRNHYIEAKNRSVRIDGKSASVPRPPLWNDLNEAKRQIAYGLSQCDILKIADNELEFMTGEQDFDKGAAILKAQYPNIRLLNVTAGAEGSYSYYGEMRVFVPSFKLGGTIETTGAGDTFCASVLSFVLENGLIGLTEYSLEQMLRFANAAAYMVTTKKGAIRSMPEREQVEDLLARVSADQ